MPTTISHRRRRKGRRRFIETYDFSPALKAKLHEELGDTRTVEIALDGLRSWYLACLYADGELLGMPSRAVDEAWHEMILMTREYMHFCRQAFGGYLHHSPDTTLDEPMDSIVLTTLAVVDAHDLPMALFTADADAGLEDGYRWEPSDLRRMRDAAAARATRRRRRGRDTGWSSAFYSDGSGGGWSPFDGGGGGSDGGGGGGCGGGGGGGGGCGGGG